MGTTIGHASFPPLQNNKKYSVVVSPKKFNHFKIIIISRLKTTSHNNSGFMYLFECILSYSILNMIIFPKIFFDVYITHSVIQFQWQFMQKCSSE